ncbi:MAG: hypothetical protein ACJ76J_28465 [Thermoanaerobaculia bacterium]
MRARDNPFASDRVEKLRYRLPEGLTWDELLERLAALRFRAALVGAHGRGKTTLLEELAPRLTARGFRVRTVTLRQDERRVAWKRFRGLGADDVLFLDGAELLGRLAWLRVRLSCRRAGGLIVTSHRPGLLPTLLECDTTPELLAGLVRELTGEELETGELFIRHGGNLRLAFWEMYDRRA